MRGRLPVFVFIDALGWELARQYRFMEDELVTRSSLETVLGYSATCIPTILTGHMPRVHGHMSFFRYQPQASPFSRELWLGLLPDLPGRLRHVVSRIMQRRLGYQGYFGLYSVPYRYLQYLDYTEKRDLYQPGGINGDVPTIFDHLRAAGVPFYLADWRAPEHDNVQRLHCAIEQGEIEFAYLYLAGLDSILHAQGTRSAAAEVKVRWYERALRYIIKTATRIYGGVDLYVFSDHGMTDVVDTCPLLTQLERLGGRYGRDYAAVYDSTMVRLWIFDPVVGDRIMECLRNEPRGHILTREELARYGCDFDDDWYGQIFFLLRPGTLLCPSFMGRKPVAGMHGYAPEDARSAAFFGSTRSMQATPLRLDGLFGLMQESVIAGAGVN